MLEHGTGRAPDGRGASCQASLAPGSRAKDLPVLAWHHTPAPLQGWVTRAGLDFLPLTAPSELVVREGELTASNYPGPLVMTLCPLQFPWDTVPLLPSSPELRGTAFASQNCFFISAQRKSGLRLCVSTASKGWILAGSACESLGKEKGELCISLAAFLCCEGTQRKFFISAKMYFPEKRPPSSGSSPSHPPPLPSGPETSECHSRAASPGPGTQSQPRSPGPLLLPLGPGCCPGPKLGLRAGLSARWACQPKLLINNCKFTGAVVLAPWVPSQTILLHSSAQVHRYAVLLILQTMLLTLLQIISK